MDKIIHGRVVFAAEHDNGYERCPIPTYIGSPENVFRKYNLTAFYMTYLGQGCNATPESIPFLIGCGKPPSGTFNHVTSKILSYKTIISKYYISVIFWIFFKFTMLHIT